MPALSVAMAAPGAFQFTRGRRVEQRCRTRAQHETTRQGARRWHRLDPTTDPARRGGQRYSGLYGALPLRVGDLLERTWQKKFGADKMLALVVQERCPVQIRPRKFYSAYRWHNIAANDTEVRAMLAYAQSLQGQPFAYGAMARCVTNPGPDKRDAWFCSYLTAVVLECMPYPELHLNRANTLAVDDLHEIVAHPSLRPTHGNCSQIMPRADLDRAYAQVDPRCVLRGAPKK